MIVFAAAAQFVQRAGTNPPATGDLLAPVAVKSVLRRACYDCHSNETRWPWYSAVAPLSWLIHRDVTAGRRRLNFSEWDDYSSDPGTVSQKLEEISQSVARGDMAPCYYQVLHPSARLTATDRQTIIGWGRQGPLHQ